MESTPAPPTTLYRVLLPHPLESRLLMIHVHGEWRLPEWEETVPHPWQVMDTVNRAVAARFGMETTVLRCVSSETDRESGRTTRVYELENHSPPHDMVPGSTWVGRAELAMLGVQDPGLLRLVEDWYSRDAGEVPLRGTPWMRRGWYIEALAWTVTRLGDMGATPFGTPEQVRASERSFLMRVETDAGRFYFKAVPQVFGHEPALMEWLGEHYPEHVPELVAADRTRGWYLQREAGRGAQQLDEVREEEEWYRAVRRLAEIQMESATQLRDLRGLGCPDRGLEVLARRIPRLCQDVAAMLEGRPCGLSPAQVQQVRSLVPSLLTLCEELASHGIPDTLEHGDLEASNILSTLDGPIYLDWSESSLSHPFFSIVQLIGQAISFLPASSGEAKRRLRDSYLAPWLIHAPYESLVRAFEIARVLAPIHRATILHAEVLPAATHRWELECTVPKLLRSALRVIEAEGDVALPLEA